MMARNRHDHFYRLAKKEGYRSRAAYKLKQIDSRFRIIRRGDVVVDLGAAPGGWLQVAKELSGGTVVGVDLQPIRRIDGVTTLAADVTADGTIDAIRELIGGAGEGGNGHGRANVVLSDAAPNLSGDWSYDHARSIDLAEHALSCAEQILTPGGNFVVKVFQGDLFHGYLQRVRSVFGTVRAHSPAASRKVSAEMYIIAKKFRRARRNL